MQAQKGGRGREVTLQTVDTPKLVDGGGKRKKRKKKKSYFCHFSDPRPLRESEGRKNVAEHFQLQATRKRKKKNRFNPRSQTQSISRIRKRKKKRITAAYITLPAIPASRRK